MAHRVGGGPDAAEICEGHRTGCLRGRKPFRLAMVCAAASLGFAVVVNVVMERAERRADEELATDAG